MCTAEIILNSPSKGDRMDVGPLVVDFEICGVCPAHVGFLALPLFAADSGYCSVRRRQVLGWPFRDRIGFVLAYRRSALGVGFRSPV